MAAFTKFYETIANSVKLYFAFHAYGQYILTPFGHTFIPPDNYYELMTIGLSGKAAISRRYGTEYVVGAIAEVLCKSTFFNECLWLYCDKITLQIPHLDLALIGPMVLAT